uniref:Putative ovule protein n=1 Tax=Solanum chacoense TaxID=4108 RepID=A0A0V0H5P1_SOLCH
MKLFLQLLIFHFPLSQTCPLSEIAKPGILWTNKLTLNPQEQLVSSLQTQKYAVPNVISHRTIFFLELSSSSISLFFRK